MFKKIYAYAWEVLIGTAH